MPSNAKTTCHSIWRTIKVDFVDEIFPLSMPSVCPRLTTVKAFSFSLFSTIFLYRREKRGIGGGKEREDFYVTAKSFLGA